MASSYPRFHTPSANISLVIAVKLGIKGKQKSY
jgi:hypothetical protein